MSSSEPTLFLAGLKEANEREVDIDLATALVKALSEQGYCSSRQSETWRIVNRPLCPIKVQLEIRDLAEKTIDLIPLSAYTDSIEEHYPLVHLELPHTVSLPFRTEADIEEVIEYINFCFPKR